MDNYTTLQTTVLAKAHRGDLTSEVVDCIRECEGRIRRKLRATETRTTLEEADRSSEGVYNLPATIQEVRQVYATGSDGSTYALENVGLAGIRLLPANADVQHYGVSGTTIEFRGVPATDASIEIVGFGWPDPLDTTASNDLLTYHEAIYIYGTLYYLYLHTQDLELAKTAEAEFDNAVEQLNQLIGRKIGGGQVMPAYNFGHVQIGTGY